MILQIPDGATAENTDGLIPSYAITREQRNALEFANINDAYKKYFLGSLSNRKAPFTLDWLYRVHREMLGKVWKWAGKPRTSNFNIGVPYPEIQTSLHLLLQNLAYWQKTALMEPLEIACRLHHELVRIHPFRNGNGRWARFISNIYLRKAEHPLVSWPEEKLTEQSPFRQKYIGALKQADQGVYDALITLNRNYLAKE